MQSINKITVLFFVGLSCIFISCSLKHELEYNKYSLYFLQESDTLGRYNIINSDAGIESFTFSIDSLYGTKKRAWLNGTIINRSKNLSAFYVYSCKIIEHKKKYGLSKILGHSDSLGKIQFKTLINTDTIRFIIKDTKTSVNQSKLFQITGIKFILK
jgi:hypothetical protein